MVDGEIRATGWIFLIDFGIFCGYVLVWFAIRGTRGDKGVVLPNWKSGKQELNTARFTQRDLRPSVSEEVQDNKHEETQFKNLTFLEDEEFPELEKCKVIQSLDVKTVKDLHDFADE